MVAQATAIECTPGGGEGPLRLHGDTPKDTGSCEDIVSTWTCEPSKGGDDGGEHLDL